MSLRKWWILIAVCGAVLLIDQLSKAWVIANLEPGETRLIAPALHPVLQLTRTANTGVAFGIASGNSSIFLILILAIIGFLFVLYYRSEPQDTLQHVGLAVILGGALGNVIDRVRFGHVVDFFHVMIPPLSGDMSRPLISNVSNFADHFIIIGVIVLLIDTYLQDRREKELAAQQRDELAAGVDLD